MIHIYAKGIIGTTSSTATSNQEIELHENLSIILQILCNMLSAEYEGLCPEDVELAMESDAVSVSVVFDGVNTILPLVTQPMLQYPTLLGDYMNLISQLFEFCPSRLKLLQPTLLQSMMASIMFGMDQSFEIAQSCLQSIKNLAIYSIRKPPALPILQSCSQALVRHIISRPFDSNLLSTAATVIVVLWRLYPDDFENMLVHNNPHGQSLKALAVNVSPILMGPSLVQFQIAFVKFVAVSKASTVLW